MKKTEEKIAPSGRGKAANHNPNPVKPQQPHRENRQSPDRRDNRREHPEEWQATIPPEHPGKEQPKSEVDLDDDNEEVLDDDEESGQEESTV